MAMNGTAHSSKWDSATTSRNENTVAVQTAHTAHLAWMDCVARSFSDARAVSTSSGVGDTRDKNPQPCVKRKLSLV